MNNIHPTILQAIQPFIPTNSENKKPSREEVNGETDMTKQWDPQDEETEVNNDLDGW